MTTGFTYVKKNTSPIQYFFNIGDPNVELPELEEIDPSTYFASAKDPNPKMVIYFSQPFVKNQLVVQTVALTTLSRNTEKNTATCTFQCPEKPLTLFSFNHHGIYSRIDVLTEEDKCLKTYNNYILDDNEKKPHIFSLSGSLEMQAQFLTTEEEQALPKPPVCRVLFPEAFPTLPEKTPSKEIQIYEHAIRYGAIVKVDTISVTFRLTSPDEQG